MELFWQAMVIAIHQAIVESTVLIHSLMLKVKKWLTSKLYLLKNWPILTKWEKKGFMDTLGHVEANGVKVAVISTDRHPQIKKEMRVNHGEVSHAFDPWHVAKSISKKLSAASKKSGCSELVAWIPSLVAV